MPRLSLLLTLAAVAVASAQTERVPPSSRVAGVVLDASSARVLAKARVVLEPVEAGPVRRVASTDDGGAFVIDGIGPGRYRLWAERAGYLRQAYGQPRPGGRRTILELGPGRVRSDLLFRLVPSSVLAGEIYDEDGESVPGVSVQLSRLENTGGLPRYVPSGRGETDDRGRFRIHGLSAGQYLVYGTPEPSAGITVADYASGRTRGRVSAPTYYPGTPDPAGAVALEVDAGVEMTGVDFPILVTRTVALRGRALDARSGGPAVGATLFLLPREQWIDPGSVLSPSTVGSADGSFEIGGVVPGRRTLFAIRIEAEQTFAARVPVEIDEHDVGELELWLRPTVVLHGRFHFPSETEAVRLEGVRISLRPEEPLPFFPEPAASDETGAFTLEHAIEGRYRLHVANLPESLYVRAARFRNRDLLEEGLVVDGTGEGGGIEILLGAAARIEGRIVEESQTAGPEKARVILVPEVRPHRSDLYRLGEVDADGRFTLRGVAPGTYRVFACRSVDAGTAYLDPEYLRWHEAEGRLVELSEREALLSLELRVRHSGY